MADEEHFKRLKQGIAEWNAWRRDNPTISPDLRDADLSNLITTNLFSTKLFSTAHLSRADLSRACAQ
jgi:hypothetical protein